MTRDSRSSARVLYLSYDGMCDPLGGSQVLPYLVGLARRGHRISLISFEKPERSKAERRQVEQLCEEAGIEWHALAYHKNPPVLSTLYDLRSMQRLAARLQRRAPFDVVHCRSYIPALAGLRLKRQSGMRFLFDMRGFWADERVEGGQWNLTNPLFRAVYNYFKRRERDFWREADAIVSLTEAAREIVEHANAGRPGAPPISVIPCCVDFDAFPPVSQQTRATARQKLGIPEMATVAAYLGSFGSWYMVDEMLDFFRVQLERDPDAIFLIISREPEHEIVAAAERHGIGRDRLVVRSATRAEVPQFISAADYGLFFIMPVFSKKASSPTKMGELLALELPMVTNGGVGDVERILDETGAGVIVKAFDEASYREALDSLSQLSPDMDRWRTATRTWLDLEQGVDRYDAIYAALCEGTVSR